MSFKAHLIFKMKFYKFLLFKVNILVVSGKHETRKETGNVKFCIIIDEAHNKSKNK